MFGYLSSVPVSKLMYSVFDPENHGNSISPFFDAKKKLPELFGDQIYISKNEIANKIEQLNTRIENLLQDKIGTEYANIFDYAREQVIMTSRLNCLQFMISLRDLMNVLWAN